MREFLKTSVYALFVFCVLVALTAVIGWLGPWFLLFPIAIICWGIGWVIRNGSPAGRFSYGGEDDGSL